MGRLTSKAVRSGANDARLVNYAGNRDDGLQVGEEDDFGAGTTVCVPLSGTSVSPLKDRKFVLLTFPADNINIGKRPVASSDYQTYGARRGTTGTGAPTTEYSNRKQLLRGQYLYLAFLTDVEVCVTAFFAVEIANSLEVS